MELVCEKNPNEKVLKEKKEKKDSDEEPILHMQQCWYPECISSKDTDITIQIQKARMLIKISSQVANKWNGLLEAPTLAVFLKEDQMLP